MRILLIHQAFAALDEAGGTRHYEMARNLAAQGHEMIIITSPVSYLSGKTRTARMHWVETETPEAGITILRSYAYAALHRSFVHRVFSFFSFMFSSFFVGLGVKNVDLVWGTSPPIFQGWTAWLLARLKGVPFLFEVRDLWPAFAIAVGVLRSKLLIHLSEWLEGFLYRHADCVVVNSPGYVKHVQGRGARRVELIPNGADPAMFDPQADGLPFRCRHGLDGRFVVLYAGAHGMSNDLGVVLDAAEILRDRPAVRFMLVGDGKEKAGLQAEAQRRGLDNVTFVASVSKNEMAGVLAASDACLAILKPLEMYKTTYPNKVFDYMAAGKAVVLAIDGVIREVVESAGAGLAVRPGDAQSLADVVLRMEADRDGTRRMGENGRECIETRFDRALFSAQFLDLLNRMRRERG